MMPLPPNNDDWGTNPPYKDVSGVPYVQQDGTNDIANDLAGNTLGKGQILENTILDPASGGNMGLGQYRPTPDMLISKLLGDIRQERQKEVGGFATVNPIDFINTSDYVINAAPKNVTDKDLYAGTQPTVSAAPAKYFGYTPIFQGGSILYPTGLKIKREEAIAEAIKAKQIADNEKAKTAFDKLKMVEARPNYQSLVDKKYQDEIISGYTELLKKYGRNKFIEMMNNPMEYPEVQQLLMKYNRYEALARATKDGDKQIQEIQKELKENKRVLGVGEQQMITKYLTGQMNEDELLNFPNSLRTYQSLDSAMNDIKDFVLKEANTYFNAGVIDKSGKSIGQDGMITKTKEHMLTEEKLNEITFALMATGKIDPNIPIDVVRAYIVSVMPTIIEKDIVSRSRTNINIGGPNKPKTEVVIPQTNNVPVRNKNGVFNIKTNHSYPLTDEKEIVIPMEDLMFANTTNNHIYDNAIKSHFGGGETAKVVPVGIYYLPLDKNGQVTNSAKDTANYGWMVLVEKPKENNNAYWMPQTSSSATSDEMRVFVPYNNIKSKLSVIIEPDKQDESKYVVVKKDVVSGQKKQQVGDDSDKQSVFEQIQLD